MMFSIIRFVFALLSLLCVCTVYGSSISELDNLYFLDSYLLGALALMYSFPAYFASIGLLVLGTVHDVAQYKLIGYSSIGFLLSYIISYGFHRNQFLSLTIFVSVYCTIEYIFYTKLGYEKSFIQTIPNYFFNLVVFYFIISPLIPTFKNEPMYQLGN